MRVFVPSQKVLKEWTWACKDHLVSFHLLTILTGQGHISKVSIFSQLSKCTNCILLEVVPLQTQLFWHCVQSEGKRGTGLKSTWYGQSKSRKDDNFKHCWTLPIAKQQEQRTSLRPAKLEILAVLGIGSRSPKSHSASGLQGWHTEDTLRTLKTKTMTTSKIGQGVNRRCFYIPKGSHLCTWICWEMERTSGDRRIKLQLDFVSQTSGIRWNADNRTLSK